MPRRARGPRRLGSYTLGAHLGGGGTAEVYSAVHEATGESVAVKILRTEVAANTELREGFLREAEVLNRIDHPGVVRLIDLRYDPAPRGAGGNAPAAWIATELVPGTTLSTRVREHGPLGERDALTLAMALLDALEAVHRAGFAHRDVTPANTMLAVVADAPLAPGDTKLIDFGIADRLGKPATDQAGSVLGTPLYLSPEHAQGLAVTEASDLYQLGGVLHYALTGAPPFRSEDPLDTMRAHVEDSPAPPSLLRPGLSAAVDRIVLRALRKDQEQRFPSAATMRAALQDALTAESTRVGRVGSAEPSPPSRPDADEVATAFLLPASPGPSAVEGAVQDPEAGQKRVRGTARGSSLRRRARAARGSRRGATVVAGVALFAAALALAVIATLQVADPRGIDAKSTTAPPTAAPQAAPVFEPPTTQPVPTTAPPTERPSEQVEQVSMPQLVGLSLEEARAAMRAAGLRLGAVSREHSPEAAGTVLSASAHEGESLSRGARVRLTIASGANRIPELDGLTATDAVTVLGAAGFLAVFEDAAAVPGDPGSPAVPQAPVSGSAPEAGSEAKLGTSVLLSLSTPDPEPNDTTSARQIQDSNRSLEHHLWFAFAT